jgi:hypothetical protein
MQVQYAIYGVYADRQTVVVYTYSVYTMQGTLITTAIKKHKNNSSTDMRAQ